MERLNAYSSRTDGGGVSVDVEGMLVDLATVWKASGQGRAEFLAFAAQVFDDVKVSVKIPDRHKN